MSGDSAEDLGARTVYCGNLSYQVSWQDLKDVMKPIGEVEHVEILQYRDGRKTGSGIVRFKNTDDAKKAIKELYDTELKGRPLYLREDKEGGVGPGSKGKGTVSADVQERQVFVGNLSYKTSWQDLKDLMKSVGEVEFCDILAASDGFRSAGCGLVRYASQEQAKKAIDELSDTELDGRKIFVREDKEGKTIKGKGVKGKSSYGGGGKGYNDSWSSNNKGYNKGYYDKGYNKGYYGKGGKGKGGKGKGTEYSVYVGKIPRDIDWKTLKDGFKKFSPTHADVGEFRNEQNRGYGLVKFATYYDAEAAIDKIQWIGDSKVECKWDEGSGY